MEFLKFEPLLKQTIWGGDKIIPFKHLEKSLDQVGESWEVSGVKDNETVVANGEYKGWKLNDVLAEQKELLVGKENYARYGNLFPLLIKFIDARQQLSIQVHPNDEQAQQKGLPRGKTEMWYVMKSDPTASLRSGLKQQITPAEYKQMVEDDTITDALAEYPVKDGDVFFLPAGRIHSIGAGCFLVEIQEPTDYTIRVERTTPSGFAVADSMCHQGLGFEKMFECFHYEPHSREEIHDRWFIEPETVLKTAGGSITTLVGYRNTPLFRLDEVNVSDTLTVDCPPRGSGIYVLEGAGTLSANGRSLPLKKTDQLFVPAGTGRFTLDAEAPLRVLHFFGPEQKQ